MVKNSDGLLRIFWPNSLTRTTTPGVMVGWRNSEFDLFVVTVLEDVEVCGPNGDVAPWLTTSVGAQC